MNYKYVAMAVIAIVFLFESFIQYLEMKSADRKIPENVKDVYDKESYAKWLAYHKEKTRLDFFRHIAMYAVTFVTIGCNVHARLLNLLGVSGDYAAGNLVLVIDGLIFMIALMAFDYVDTMGVEQKYGFNRTTKKTFFIDQLKSLIMDFVITCGILSLFILVHRALGNWFLPVFVGIMLVFLLALVIISPFMGRIFNKFTPLPDGELRERLCALLSENGCTVKEIKVMDASKRSSKANAYFSGLGKTKTIVLYDTLLELMTDDEIVAVFAHEMGHNKHKDTLKLYGINVFNIVIYVLIAWVLVSKPEIYTYFGFSGLNYGYAFILLTSVCLAFLSPFLRLISGVLVRKCEYAADRFAAENGYGEALISGLKLLSKDSFICLSPHPLVVKLTYDHPTMSQRIEAIEGYMSQHK